MMSPPRCPEGSGPFDATDPKCFGMIIPTRGGHIPTMTPSLPPSIITEILSHLLPPLPPIPDHLIAKSLFDRITFLPPDPDDLDAWLSPAPPVDATVSEDSSRPHILGDRLKRLYDTGYTLGPVLYAHDGEHVLARLPIIPQDYHPQPHPQQGTSSSSSRILHNDTEHGIDVMFIHESEDRGWVYQSSKLPYSNDTDTLSWSSIASSLPTTPPAPAEMTPEEYWRDFGSPKATGYIHPGGIEGEEEEDAYWALYAQSGGQSGVGTRNQSVADFAQMRDSTTRPEEESALNPGPTHTRSMEDHKEEDLDGHEGDHAVSGRVMCDLPTQNGTLDPLAALLSTIPDRITENRSRSNTLRRSSVSSESPKTSNRETNDLRDKIQGGIQSSLRNAWMEYTRNAGESHEDLEIKAMSWLRIGRGILDSTSTPVGDGLINGEGGGVEEKVVQAKMEVLWDMFGMISTLEVEVEERKETFWRLMEGCVKKSVVPGIEEQRLTQEMYWE